MTDSSNKPLRATVLPYTMLTSGEETEHSRCILPEDVKTAIPPLHTQDMLPDGKVTAYARLTCDEPGWTWFLLDLHEDGDTFSGYWIEREQEQFGYFSLAHMQDKITFSIAYDASFTPRLLSDAVQEERRIRRLRGERFRLQETDSLAEHRAYYYAARYDQPSPQAFTTIRTLISEKQVDLSVYMIQLGVHWHVVVIGDRPAERVHTRIMEALNAGTMTIIPYDLLLQLYARKLEANQKAGRREGHRPIVLKRKQQQKSLKNKRR